MVVRVGSRSGAPNQQFVRDGVNDNGLLHETAEEFAAIARLAPIEPEGELIQVKLQMLS